MSILRKIRTLRKSSTLTDSSTLNKLNNSYNLPEMNNTQNLNAHVINRKGKYEDVRFSEIEKRIDDAIDGNLKHNSTLRKLNVDKACIVAAVIGSYTKGITTKRLDEIAAKFSAEKMKEDPEYGWFASRITVSNHHRNTLDGFSEKMLGKLKSRLSKRFVKFVSENKETLDKIPNYSRDYHHRYFGIKTLEKNYMMTDNKKVIIERTQDTWLRVAVQLFMDSKLDNHMYKIKELYEALSNRELIFGTPTIYASGTPRPQLQSCFLLSIHDSIDGMYDLLKDVAQISKWAGGIGINGSDLRSYGSFIKGTGGVSSGPIPFFKVLEKTLEHVDQGGKRKGNAAIYMSPHHPDIESFLEMKMHIGGEKTSEDGKNIYIAMWIDDVFMERLHAGKYTCLFDPDRFPKLNNTYGIEFKKLYFKYEMIIYKENYARLHEKFVKEKNTLLIRKLGSLEDFCLRTFKDFKNDLKGIINPTIIYKKIVKCIGQTGTPYILFKDHVNRKNMQENLGTIKCSNLCAETVLFSSSEKGKEEDACCVLGSLCLTRFVKIKPGHEKDIQEMEDQVLFGCATSCRSYTPWKHRYFDYESLGNATRILTRALDRVIDVNYYPVEKARKSNLAHRPIGIGIQGLANVFFKMGLAYDSDTALQLNNKIAECIYRNAVIESIQLAKELGPYSTYEGSPWSKGLVQADLWGVKLSDEWIVIKEALKKYGIRNSTLTAFMPTASTSQIQGNFKCFEQPTYNTYTRRTIAGIYVIVNRYLVKELKARGLWTDKTVDYIINNKGSIQGIKFISKSIQRRYKTAFEIKPSVILKMSAGRAPYVDQTQSMNLYVSEITVEIMWAIHYLAWKLGLKTGQYYCHSQTSYNNNRTVTTSEKDYKKLTQISDEYEGCLSCSG